MITVRTNKFSIVAQHKINIRKVVVFWYTNNDLSEKEAKKTISFKIATERIKYKGINLTKEKKVLYTENYTTLMKEVKDNTDNWKEVIFTEWKN